MEVVWLGIALVCGLVWAWISISQKASGDRHQRAARAATAIGDWEQAVLSYKLAIISRLDAENKVRELVGELSEVYASRERESDLSQILECPRMLKALGAGTGNQRKKNELIVKLYKETGDFLDGLPGPSLPEG